MPDTVVLGIDEVGRGCWAGPLVAGAVVLGEPIDGLTDSKLLNAKQRARLAAEVYASARAAGLGWVSAAEVDELGLTAAVALAMERAVAETLAIDVVVDEIIIDGNFNFLATDVRARALIKADLTVPAVSAASIIAKVARDTWMAEAAVRFPTYGFERHVGYGTALHRAALAKHGICELHRKSYKPIQQILLHYA